MSCLKKSCFGFFMMQRASDLSHVVPVFMVEARITSSFRAWKLDLKVKEGFRRPGPNQKPSHWVISIASQKRAFGSSSSFSHFSTSLLLLGFPILNFAWFLLSFFPYIYIYQIHLQISRVTMTFHFKIYKLTRK